MKELHGIGLLKPPLDRLFSFLESFAGSIVIAPHCGFNPILGNTERAAVPCNTTSVFDWFFQMKLFSGCSKLAGTPEEG